MLRRHHGWTLGLTAVLVAACAGGDDGSGASAEGDGSGFGSGDGESAEAGSDGASGSASGTAGTGVSTDGADSGGSSASGGSGGSASGGEGDSGGETDGGLPGDDGEVCFYAPDDLDAPPGAKIKFAVVEDTFMGKTALYVRLTLDLRFVDNTYGVNSVGWEMSKPRKHTFDHLLESDHAEIWLRDAADQDVLAIALDYISVDASAPSGYACLGVWGGEGSMLMGDASSVLGATSSLDRNLNERGYAGYTVDSPPTDRTYVAPPEAPDWDYWVIYEAWVDFALFEDRGVGVPIIRELHASPSKEGSNSKDVVPDDCPPPGDEPDDTDSGGPPGEGGDGPGEDSGDDSAGTDTGGCPPDPEGQLECDPTPPIP